MIDAGPRKQIPWLRVVAGLSLAAAVVFAYVHYRHVLSLTSLVQHEDALRHHLVSTPALVFLLATALYVGVTGLSLPGSLSLTVLYGWYFGFWKGLVLVSFASTAGATIAFLISRCLLNVPLEARFGAQLAKFNESLKRDGPFYLLSLRLIPVVPFFAVNAAMGLTPIRLRTYWWASQLGMLPASAIYVYAGSSVPSLKALAEQGLSGILTGKSMAALILLGSFPLLAGMLKNRLGRRPTDQSQPASTEQSAYQ